MAFFGYRLFRPTSFIFGALFFGVIIFVVCWEHTDWKTNDKWWLALLIGGLAGTLRYAAPSSAKKFFRE
jgi:hypothetical protein